MMSEYIPDNYDLYVEHEAEQERWLASRPKCDKCGEPIQDDYAFDIEGDILCYECAEAWLHDQEVDVDQLMKEGW